MSTVTTSTLPVAPPETEWYKQWFDEDYLRLYRHRDQADADRVVALLRSVVPLRAGWRVLDVGCGAGRHARALALAGARCIGVDLSPNLLSCARHVDAALVQADMRALPVRARTMDFAVSLCTSFGFFEWDHEHAATLREMSGTLRRGGWLALDVLYAPAVHAIVRACPPAAKGPAIGQRRLSHDGRYVYKIVKLTEDRMLEERVRLFTARELERLLSDVGVVVKYRFGDYDGGSLGPTASRTVLVGQAL